MNKINNFSQELKNISTDRQNGATAMLQNLIEVVEKILSSGRSLSSFKNELLLIQKRQEHFTNLNNFVTWLIKNINNKQEIEGFLFEVKNYYNSLVYNHSATILQEISTKNLPLKILTHSNSSLTQKVVIELNNKIKSVKIFQTISSPGNEGKIQADFFCKNKIATSLIDDVSVARYLKNIDIVILGCDKFNKNFFVNKSGSFLIAKLAQELSKPVYVLCDKMKYTEKNLTEFIEIQHNCPVYEKVILEKIPAEFATKILK